MHTHCGLAWGLCSAQSLRDPGYNAATLCSPVFLVAGGRSGKSMHRDLTYASAPILTFPWPCFHVTAKKLRGKETIWIGTSNVCQGPEIRSEFSLVKEKGWGWKESTEKSLDKMDERPKNWPKEKQSCFSTGMTNVT